MEYLDYHSYTQQYELRYLYFLFLQLSNISKQIEALMSLDYFPAIFQPSKQELKVIFGLSSLKLYS